MDINQKIDKRGWESARVDDIHLLIEMTDFCNARCIMCKQSISRTMHADNAKQHMDFALFVKIIDDMRSGGFKATSVDPLWTGESTVNPDFKEMLYYLFTMNKSLQIFRGFVFNTNAISMDEEISDIFLDYARYIASKKEFFMRLYFSLEAVNTGTYEKIKNIPGKNLERVVNNIKYLIDKRKKMGLIIPNLIFGFIVMKENEKEAEEFRKFWEDILNDSGVPYEIVPTWPLLTDRDSIYYRQLICQEPKKAERIHRKTALRLGLIKDIDVNQGKTNRKIKHSNFRHPCGALWRTPNIASNGDVVPCCRDVELTMVLGNIKTQSLYDIWYGDKATELRLSHIKGEFTVPFEKYPTCRTCMEPEAGIFSDDEIFRYLEELGREDLKGIYKKNKEFSLNK